MDCALEHALIVFYLRVVLIRVLAHSFPLNLLAFVMGIRTFPNDVLAFCQGRPRYILKVPCNFFDLGCVWGLSTIIEGP